MKVAGGHRADEARTAGKGTRSTMVGAVEQIGGNLSKVVVGPKA